MHRFDRDISVLQEGTSRFKADVTGSWSINGNPNGGYLMALLANALLPQSDKRSIAVFTAGFFSRCAPGEAQIEIEHIHRSKQFDRWQARLIQEGNEKVRALGTFMDRRAGGDRLYEKSPPDLAEVGECVQIPEIPQYPFFDQMDVRLDPSCVGWMHGRLSDRSEQKGWVRFKDDRPFDEPAVLLALDSFPPPVLATRGLIPWVPTIEFSASVRALPGTRWLKCLFRSHFISRDAVEEDGEVWDEDGELVAISRQISLYRSTEEEDR